MREDELVLRMPGRPLIGGGTYDEFVRMLNHDLHRMLDPSYSALDALRSLHADPAARAVLAKYGG